MEGLRPPYPPTGFPARFAGGNGGNYFDLFRLSLGTENKTTLKSVSLLNELIQVFHKRSSSRGIKLAFLLFIAAVLRGKNCAYEGVPGQHNARGHAPGS